MVVEDSRSLVDMSGNHDQDGHKLSINSLLRLGEEHRVEFNSL